VDLAGLKLMAKNEGPAQALITRAQADPASEMSPLVCGRLGSWYYRAGEYNEAAKLLGIAVEQRPGELAFRIGLGWALIEQRNFERAQQYFVTTLASQANSPGATMGLAVSRWLGREREQAMRDFAAATEAEPFWLNSKWVEGNYSPLAARTVSEMQTARQKRKPVQTAASAQP
jgi:Flp pilus assembly protein TadD